MLCLTLLPIHTRPANRHFSFIGLLSSGTVPPPILSSSHVGYGPSIPAVEIFAHLKPVMAVIIIIVLCHVTRVGSWHAWLAAVVPRGSLDPAFGALTAHLVTNQSDNKTNCCDTSLIR